ncbi:unnamed protein product [Acidithrix sp. C25]|nr:unnamed protein product [Acidithrix sp. C25]
MIQMAPNEMDRKLRVVLELVAVATIFCASVFWISVLGFDSANRYTARFNAMATVMIMPTIRYRCEPKVPKGWPGVEVIPGIGLPPYPF